VNYFTATTLASMARCAGLDVVRMGVFDRSPLSDSLYAVLGEGGSSQSARRAA
jgi:hypothetical protein